jgi:hypothetical protein
MTTAPSDSATGTTGESRPSVRRRAVLPSVDGGVLIPAVPAGPAAGAASRAASAGSTSVPTPWVPGGTENPQSSSSAAWSAARIGTLSVSITLTTSRRPFRSAAVTKVCRAASVKPVFPPRSPA